MIRVVAPDLFRDEDDIQLGEPWREKIDDAIRRATIVFVFWCAHARDSEEVRREIDLSVIRKKRMIPVLLDSTTLSSELADYQFLDLRNLVSAHSVTEADRLGRRPRREPFSRPGRATPSWYPTVLGAFTLVTATWLLIILISSDVGDKWIWGVALGGTILAGLTGFYLIRKESQAYKRAEAEMARPGSAGPALRSSEDIVTAAKMLADMTRAQSTE